VVRRKTDWELRLEGNEGELHPSDGELGGSIYTVEQVCGKKKRVRDFSNLRVMCSDNQ